ncbi:hypothetical protein CDAR_310061 [Caerostris darwini]|uniref:Uncharacterized protein n=1 Tax=Caerostris darwini TaxID=1538125 RepID=A0AAV4WTB5_9ARAC|nr:hypothetical protein CDAR_310061 [Caerostris darwini]
MKFKTQCYRFPNFPHIHTNASSSQGNELLRIRNGKRMCVMGRGGVVTLQEKKKRTNSDPEDRPCPNCTSESPGGVRFNDVKRWGKGGGRKKGNRTQDFDFTGDLSAFIIIKAVCP